MTIDPSLAAPAAHPAGSDSAGMTFGRADGITIVTNHHRRPILDAWQLTPAEQAQFDYLDWPAIEAGSDSASFVRFLGELYDLGDMERGPGGETNPFPGWDTYKSDTFFSGIVIRYVTEDHEDSVVIGRYFS